MDHLLRFLLHSGEMQKKFILEKIPSKDKKISKCTKKISFFRDTITEKEIDPKKKWFKKFEKYWVPGEENALNELKKFVKDKN